jgi:hypothetical protein
MPSTWATASSICTPAPKLGLHVPIHAPPEPDSPGEAASCPHAGGADVRFSGHNPVTGTSGRRFEAPKSD